MKILCKVRVGDKIFSPTFAMTVSVAIAFAILFSLGSWQLRRLAWKEEMLARIQRSIAAPAIPMPDPIGDARKLDYRRVVLSGHLLNELEIILGGRPRPGQVGYNILTPMRLDDGRLFIVNRGWVPQSRLAPDAHADAKVPDHVRLTGIVRFPPEPNFLTPPPDPAHRLFFAYDIPGFAALLGERPQQLIVEADADTTIPGGPEGGVTSITFPNNHLQYAITWYCLAGALLVIWGIYSTRSETDLKRIEREDEDSQI